MFLNISLGLFWIKWLRNEASKHSSCIRLGQVASLETALGTEHYWATMLSLSLIPALAQYLVLPFCPESPRFLLINRGEESNAEAGGSQRATFSISSFRWAEKPFRVMAEFREWRHVNAFMHIVDALQQLLRKYFNPTALLRLRGSTEKVFAELKEMKEEAAHTQSSVTVQEFFKKRSYKQPIILVLVVNLGSQLSGFNAVSHMKFTCLWEVSQKMRNVGPVGPTEPKTYLYCVSDHRTSLENTKRRPSPPE